MVGEARRALASKGEGRGAHSVVAYVGAFGCDVSGLVRMIAYNPTIFASATCFPYALASGHLADSNWRPRQLFYGLITCMFIWLARSLENKERSRH